MEIVGWLDFFVDLVFDVGDIKVVWLGGCVLCYGIIV